MKKPTYRQTETDYGLPVTEETTYREDTPVLYLMRRNGAWLQMLVGEAHDDLTPIECFDAFSNLKDAKRDSMTYAKESDDFGPPYRWVESSGHGWDLHATYLDRVLYFVDDDGTRSFVHPSDEEDDE